MKGLVDYKHPKKMKKRRQLDALVDTVKLPRSRKNSTSAQELLDCHSDSSEIDELTLSQTGSKKKNRCCICQSIAAQIGLFMVTMACLTTCAGIIWVQWHLRHEIDSLRKQVTSAQNPETVPPFVLKFQSQLAEVNKSVVSMKSGPSGLLEITNTIRDFKSKLKDLHDANKRLQASVSASKEVLGLPAKMSSLSTMLATLGSDFKDFMNMQTSKYNEMEKRVATLESEPKEGTRNPNSSVNIQLNQLLSEKLTNYNISLHTRLQSLNQELERHSVRISTLEEFTKAYSQNSRSSFNNTAVTHIVNKLLEEKMANLIMDSDINASESGLAQETLSGKISHILQKDEKKLNDKLLTLRRKVDDLTGRLDSHDSTLISLTAAVESIKNKGTLQNAANFPVTGTVSTPADSTGSIPRSGDILTDKDKTAAVIHVEGINTIEDLIKALNTNIHGKDVQLDIETLNNLLNATLSAKDLRQFDADRNGLYSVDEIAKALGFHKKSKR